MLFRSWVGRSNATETPCWPPASRYRNRAFVSSAEAKPAYWRIVHGRPRYMSLYGPRVNGGVPGGSSAAGTSFTQSELQTGYPLNFYGHYDWTHFVAVTP